MGVEHLWAAQRGLTARPPRTRSSGASSDPWLAAAGLAPGDVIPGVVGYEWDSLKPGCFAGRVVPLMTARLPGADGSTHSAEMVRATAPSGGRVFAMGTMELGWRSTTSNGRSPDPRDGRVRQRRPPRPDASRAACRADDPAQRPGTDCLGASAGPGPARPPGTRAPGAGRSRVRGQPPVGVPAAAPAPRYLLCRGCRRPVGGVGAADRYRAAGSLRVAAASCVAGG